jgi:hypothetical protein
MTNSVSQEVKPESRRITSQEKTSELRPGKVGAHSETNSQRAGTEVIFVIIAYQSIKEIITSTQQWQSIFGA